MVEKDNRRKVSKIYCEKCNTVFGSKDEYEKHFDRHFLIATSEECPLDTLMGKLLRAFRRKH